MLESLHQRQPSWAGSSPACRPQPACPSRAPLRIPCGSNTVHVSSLAFARHVTILSLVPRLDQPERSAAWLPVAAELAGSTQASQTPSPEQVHFAHTLESATLESYRPSPARHPTHHRRRAIVVIADGASTKPTYIPLFWHDSPSSMICLPPHVESGGGSEETNEMRALALHRERKTERREKKPSLAASTAKPKAGAAPDATRTYDDQLTMTCLNSVKSIAWVSLRSAMKTISSASSSVMPSAATRSDAYKWSSS